MTDKRAEQTAGLRQVKGGSARVETAIGTSVIETPNRLHNPVTEQSVYMENLSEDGYCRRFMAMLYAQNGGCNHVNLNSSPVATFDKEKWRLEETDGHYALVKREPDTEFDKRVMEGGNGV